MTKKEITSTRDLTFSGWIRTNLPDSSTGFLVSDLDFIIFNYKTKKILLLEVKTRNAVIRPWQKILFENIDRWIKNGIDKEWMYCGFHIVQFENNSSEDGKCWLDGKETDPFQLKEFLSL